MQISSVRNLIENQKKKKSEKNWLPKLHHVLMKEYGWIPFDDFKRMPLPTIWHLVDQINEQRKYEKQEMERGRR